MSRKCRTIFCRLHLTKAPKDRINLRGVFRASEESGTDLPHKGVFRNTALNSSFNTLDIDRYLLLDDNHRMHQMAATVPYDTIVVLVNSTTYGGGAICLVGLLRLHYRFPVQSVGLCP